VHQGIGVPHLSMVCSTLGTLAPWLSQLGFALSTGPAGPQPIPSETMISIQALKWTAASQVLCKVKSQQAAATELQRSALNGFD
jgi:hypothetical protein